MCVLVRHDYKNSIQKELTSFVWYALFYSYRCTLISIKSIHDELLIYFSDRFNTYTNTSTITRNALH